MLAILALGAIVLLARCRRAWTRGRPSWGGRVFAGRAMLALLAGLLVAPLPAAAAAAAQVWRNDDRVFGTTVAVSIYGGTPERAARLSARVMAEFRRLHHKFHAWEPSALTALNEHIARGQPYQADAEMVALLKGAAALAGRADNTFNPAIGHLIRLWGFQSSEITPHAPEPAEIRHWLDADPRMSDLVFEGNRISSRNRAVMLDLGGYAKGYALDRAASLLRRAGVRAALINVGGNILAIGQPGARPWRVGIQDPRGPGMVATLALRDNEAVGTSGDYQRFFMQDGKRHGHIIDPRSGASVDLLSAVTIVTHGGADAGTRSDGYTKPLFIAGPQHWQAMAERLGLREVMLIDADGQVALTPAMRARLQAR
jgi:FAD:protein FMN transferase